MKYTFICDRTPDLFTLHALFSSALDNSHKNKELEYKIWSKDKIIYLILPEEAIIVGERYQFHHQGKPINIKLIKKELVLKTNYKAGKFIRLNGTISYAVHHQNHKERGLRPNICPITMNGTFENNTRTHTLNYLSKKLGINLLDEKFVRSHRFELVNIDSSVRSKENENPIYINNVFSLEVSGFINDELALNSLSVSSVGRKRNYGFGNIWVSDYEPETV